MIKKVKNKNVIIKCSEIIISLCISAITFYFVEDINGYYFIFLIPLLYGICCILSKRLYVQTNFTINSLHIICFIKYVVMPIVIVINKDYYNGILTGQIPEEKAVNNSIFLTIYEMITIFGMIAINYLFKSKKEIKETRKNKPQIEISLICVIVVGLVICLLFGETLLPQNFFIIDEGYSNTTLDIKYDGAIKILFNLFKMLLFLIGLNFCFNKYKEEKKYRYIILSGAVMLFYLAVQTSTSRWNLLMPVIIYLYFSYLYFKEKFKIIAIVVIGTLFVSIVSISLYKFSWMFKDNNSKKSLLAVLTQQVQEYFSGPRAIAQGIETINGYKKNITYVTLINDYTGSIPLLSHYVNQKDRINIYYNYHVKGENSIATQIMPIITIGLAYFGEIGSPILLIIYLIISFRLGYYEQNTRNIFYKYADCFSILALNMSIYFNTQIVFGFLLNFSIPLIIVLKLNDYFIFKKGNSNDK